MPQRRLRRKTRFHDAGQLSKKRDRATMSWSGFIIDSLSNTRLVLGIVMDRSIVGPNRANRKEQNHASRQTGQTAL